MTYKEFKKRRQEDPDFGVIKIRYDRIAFDIFQKISSDQVTDCGVRGLDGYRIKPSVIPQKIQTFISFL